MKSKTRERIYLGVTVLCVLLCALLLLSVLLDRPAFGAAAADHVPVLRPVAPADAAAGAAQAPAAAGLTVTEGKLAELIRGCLPAGFPQGAVETSIGADGAITLAMRLGRADLIDYLRAQGAALSFRQSLALRLLPRAFGVRLRLAAQSRDGALELVPRALELDDRAIDLGGLPDGILSFAERAVGAALQAAGHDYSGVSFTDGALILRDAKSS